MKIIDGNACPVSASPASLVELCEPVNIRKVMMKRFLAFTALAFASLSCAATMPMTSLNYEQFSAAVEQSSHKPDDMSGLVGTHLTLDLRSVSGLDATKALGIDLGASWVSTLPGSMRNIKRKQPRESTLIKICSTVDL